MNAPTVPAFLFDGDTFAVPSWEFRCDLPPVITIGATTAPSTLVRLFSVEWRVYRSYNGALPVGIALVAPDNAGIMLHPDGRSASFTSQSDSDLLRLSDKRTPDEFMHALKAIAERNAE